MTPRHVSVLPAEVLSLLAPAPGEVWVDATTGAGGHARLIARRVAPTGQLIAIDQDPTMLELARPQLEGLPVRFIHANFDQLSAALAVVGVEKIDGLLADLGFCSDQLENVESRPEFSTRWAAQHETRSNSRRIRSGVVEPFGGTRVSRHHLSLRRGTP